MLVLRRSRDCLGILGSVVFATACGSGSDNSPAYDSEFRDGVQVVTTHRPAWPDVRELPAEPRFTIPSSPGEGVELSLVRDAILLQDGGLAVLDSRLGQVIEFDSSGNVERVLGRRGEGPGEFSTPLTLSGFSDGALAVYDQRALRVTLFRPSSPEPVLHSLERSVFEFAPTRLWMGPEGEFLSYEGNREGARVIRSAGDVEVVGAPAAVRRVNLEDGFVDTLFQADIASEMVRRGTMLLTAPFGRSLQVDAQGHQLAIADSEGVRVHRVGPGSEHLVALMPGIMTPLTQDEVHSLRDSIRELAAEAGEPFMAEPTFTPGLQPESRPAFGAIHLSPTGWIFLEEFQPFPRRSTVYWVVSPEGRFLGRVRVPEGSEVLEVGEEEIVLLRRDEFDLPSIVVARIDWQALLAS